MMKKYMQLIILQRIVQHRVAILIMDMKDRCNVMVILSQNILQYELFFAYSKELSFLSLSSLSLICLIKAIHHYLSILIRVNKFFLDIIG